MDQPGMAYLKLIFRVLGIVGALSVASPLFASENTQVQSIAYSAEGRYFAYEEFGFDDEAGTGYSKIYIVDLVQVSQVVGTPITYRGELSNETLLEMRANAHMNAQVFLKSLQFDRQAITIAAFGDGQIDVERQNLSFGVPRYGEARRTAGKYDLILETFDTVAASECDRYTELPILGFRLTVENFGAGREVYTDKMLARSRECPVQYEIGEVVLPFGATDISNSVGLISATTMGSEGADRHFIAIPLAFSQPGIN